MAKKTVVSLEDDIDGSEASQTVKFALDGIGYEIDLSDDHANELREALNRFINTGRKVVGGRGRGQTSAHKFGQNKIATNAVRQWAQNNGYNPSSRGRINQEIVDAYNKAQK